MTYPGECQATPHAELIEQLMDSRVPKNDREHAAAREIERLRGLLREARPFVNNRIIDVETVRGLTAIQTRDLLREIDAALAADSAAPVHSHCGKPLKVANGCCVWCGYSDAETVAAVEGEK